MKEPPLGSFVYWSSQGLQSGAEKAQGVVHGLVAQVLVGGGEALPGADVSYALPFFEDLRIAVQFWHGDDEFAPRLRVLWDANADQYLRYETMYYAIGLLKSRLRAYGGE